MEYKYAVAIINSEEEKILGIFDTKEAADEFGMKNTLPRSMGLQYCFSSLFTRAGKPRGGMKIYDYYNAPLSA